MADPQKVRATDYTVVPRTLIFPVLGERVLLLKGAAHKRLWAGRLNGFGGHVLPGEDALTAARRELREEAGITPEAMHMCGTVFIDTGRNPGVLLFVFRAELTSEVSPTASPEGTPVWVDPAELHTLPLVEDLHILLPRVLTWRPGMPLFHALYHYDDQGRLHIRFGT